MLVKDQVNSLAAEDLEKSLGIKIAVDKYTPIRNGASLEMIFAHSRLFLSVNHVPIDDKGRTISPGLVGFPIMLIFFQYNTAAPTVCG